VIPVSREAARHLLIRGAALGDDPAGQGGTDALLALVHRLGFVQIDSIAAVERAHHLILHSRSHGYRHEDLRVLVEERQALWEHWTHDASVLPVGHFPHWRHRFLAHRSRPRRDAWWTERLGPDPQGTMDHVRARIEAEGPLLTRDFEGPPEHERGAGWWSWSPQKGALEHLWRVGELLIPRRDGFEKVYDLTERVLPGALALPVPDWEVTVDWACREALDRLGVATAKELADFWALVPLAEARLWVERGLRQGALVPVAVAGDERGRSVASATLDLQAVEAAAAGPPADSLPVRPLAPFDPVVRDRDRALRLWGFDYRFEAFVPKSKRKYGYYVLPLLQGESLVGRADLRTDRDGDALVVQGLWWEPGIRPTAARRRSLGTELERLAAFVGVSRVEGLRANL
jgi:uncharacterized protein YcaQ